MRSFLPPFSAALAACAPAPPDAAVRTVGPVAGAAQAADGSVAATAAARAPVPEPVSAAENPYPGSATNRDREAQGRRILSTAFVRLGPGEHLLVTLRDGQVLRLGDVTMGKVQFCGTVATGAVGKQQCRGYAEVVAASPGGARTEAPTSPDIGVAALPHTPDAPR